MLSNYPALRPSLLLDFANAAAVDPRVTFTRHSRATAFDARGQLRTFDANAPRIDYDPATLACRGLLIEEQRTNSIRNNTMQGAVAGTPGTMPTYWSSPSSTGGITRELVGTGVSNGITYIDIRYSGTATVTGSFVVQPESGTAVVAATGQSWAASAWWAIAGGSTANINGVSQRVAGRSAAGGLLENTDTSVTLAATLTRYVASRTMANASTERVTNDLVFTVGAGATIDITLRIGLPQLELGAFATSVIPTTTAAATRSMDVASMTGTNFSSWYNATQGTLYGEVSSAAQTVGGVSRRIANINDGTEADRITVGWAGETSVAAAFVTDNSVAQAGFTSPSGAYPFPTKVALAYKAADFQAAVNGSAFATVSSGTVPTVTQMRIGDVVTGSNGTQNINGHIRRIAYYPRRLTDAELLAITA